MVIFPLAAETAMLKPDQYQDMAKNIIKAELKRHGMSYRDLAAKLEEAGIRETERNLANKISRGGFSAVFFLGCLAGC
jgi:lambda repressor-like predicted transcriptional regulator